MEKWQRLEEKIVYDGFRKVFKIGYRLPDGCEHVFDITGRQGSAAVCILALTPDKQVILARQYRPGPDAVYNELPGGGVDRGEDVSVAAARELLEETGYSGSIEFVGSTFPSAYERMCRNVCVAKDCVKTAKPSLEEAESVEVIFKSLEEFRGQLRQGELTDVFGAYMALDHLGLL